MDCVAAAASPKKCPPGLLGFVGFVGFAGFAGRLDGLDPFLIGGLFCGMHTFEQPLKQHRPWLGQSRSGAPGAQHVDCKYEEQEGRVGNLGQTFLLGL